MNEPSAAIARLWRWRKKPSPALHPIAYDWRFQQMRQALVVIAKCEKCVGCSRTARDAIGGLEGLGRDGVSQDSSHEPVLGGDSAGETPVPDHQSRDSEAWHGGETMSSDRWFKKVPGDES